MWKDSLGGWGPSVRWGAGGLDRHASPISQIQGRKERTYRLKGVYASAEVLASNDIHACNTPGHIKPTHNSACIITQPEHLPYLPRVGHCQLRHCIPTGSPVTPAGTHPTHTTHTSTRYARLEVCKCPVCSLHLRLHDNGQQRCDRGMDVHGPCGLNLARWPDRPKWESAVRSIHTL